MPWPVPNRPPCSTASSTPRTDSTTPARRTAPTEATLGPAGTPRPENPTPRQPTIHTHQRNEDPETPRYTNATSARTANSPHTCTPPPADRRGRKGHAAGIGQNADDVPRPHVPRRAGRRASLLSDGEVRSSRSLSKEQLSFLDRRRDEQSTRDRVQALRLHRTDLRASAGPAFPTATALRSWQLVLRGPGDLRRWASRPPPAGRLSHPGDSSGRAAGHTRRACRAKRGCGVDRGALAALLATGGRAEPAPIDRAQLPRPHRPLPHPRPWPA